MDPVYHEIHRRNGSGYLGQHLGSHWISPLCLAAKDFLLMVTGNWYMRFSGILWCEKAYYAAFRLKEIQNQWFHLCWYGICTYLPIWTNRDGPIALDGYASMCVCVHAAKLEVLRAPVKKKIEYMHYVLAS